jgi:DNA-binding MarR family transcriptional regulator
MALKLPAAKTASLLLTEEGRSLFDEVVHSQEELIDCLLSCVTSEDHDLLSKILGRLDRTLQ